MLCSRAWVTLLCKCLQILAIKQAAAIRARSSAAQAAKRIHRFMHNLDEEYGWSRQAHKKQRTSK